MLVFSAPPGYRRSRPPARPKLDPFVGIIQRLLEEDKSRPAKQQHTAKRIFERLRDGYRYGGGITLVRAYVHEQRQRLREMFVPLRHDPGHAQVNFGEALAMIAVRSAEEVDLALLTCDHRRCRTAIAIAPMQSIQLPTESRIDY